METTDIWFASWLHSRNYSIKDFNKLARNKGAYVFEISEDDWKKEKIAFSNSSISRIKSSYTAVRDLLY